MLSTQYYVNGKIFTGKNETDFVSAMKVTDGKIEWVGSTSNVIVSNKIDLQGRTVLPGFIDSHVHPLIVGEVMDKVACTIPYVNSIEEAIEALKKQANDRNEDEWIEGWGWDETKLSEHRTLTKEDLDRVSKTRPVHVMRSDFHSSAVNSKALELANITNNTDDIFGGIIQKGENREPTGYLMENANNLVEKVKPKKDFETNVKSVVRAGQHFLELGITSATEMMALVAPYSYLDIYRQAEKEGFKQHIAMYVLWEDMKANGITEFKQSDLKGRIRIAGIKLFMDGSISGQTAAMKKPYPGTDNCGVPKCNKETLLEVYEFAKKYGIQISIHVMGDAGIQLIIDTYKEFEPWVENGPSVRIEHASILSKEQIKEINDYKMAVIPQVIFFFAEYDSYRENLDDERFYQTYVVKSMYDNIEYTALSSDAPATTWAEPDNVFTSIKAAVTRNAYNGKEINLDEKVTVPQAILLYTKKGNDVCIFNNVGMLQPGYEADFIVLDQDIFTVNPNEIDKIKVVETFIFGEKVFESSALLVK